MSSAGHYGHKEKATSTVIFTIPLADLFAMELISKRNIFCFLVLLFDVTDKK